MVSYDQWNRLRALRVGAKFSRDTLFNIVGSLLPEVSISKFEFYYPEFGKMVFRSFQPYPEIYAYERVS
jgi:hypothetical protein